MHDYWTLKQRENMLLYIKKEDYLHCWKLAIQGNGWCKLSPEQIQELCYELDTTIYLITDSVIKLIAGHFGIFYTKSGVTELLHGLGDIYKKTQLIPGMS